MIPVFVWRHGLLKSVLIVYLSPMRFSNRSNTTLEDLRRGQFKGAFRFYWNDRFFFFFPRVCHYKTLLTKHFFFFFFRKRFINVPFSKLNYRVITSDTDQVVKTASNRHADKARSYLNNKILSNPLNNCNFSGLTVYVADGRTERFSRDPASVCNEKIGFRKIATFENR